MSLYADFARFPLDHLVNMSANILFAPSMWYMKNSNQERRIAHLCSMERTCRSELGLSSSGAKTNSRFI